MKLKHAIFIIISLWISQLGFATTAPTLPDSYSGLPFSAAILALGQSGYGIISPGLSEAKIEASAIFSNDASRLISAHVSNKNSVFFWQRLSKETTENAEISLSRIGVIAVKESEKGYLTGLVLSYLYGDIAERGLASGNGFAVDFAVNFKTSKSFIIGFNLKNILAYMFWNDYDAERLPFVFQTSFEYFYKEFKITGGYESKNRFNMGAEQAINDFLTIRAGLIAKGSDIDKTAGFGVKIKQFIVSGAGIYKADKTSLYMITLGATTK